MEIPQRRIWIDLSKYGHDWRLSFASAHGEMAKHAYTDVLGQASGSHPSGRNALRHSRARRSEDSDILGLRITYLLASD